MYNLLDSSFADRRVGRPSNDMKTLCVAVAPCLHPWRMAKVGVFCKLDVS